MALGTDSGGVPAVMNVTPTGGYNNGNCGGWGGDWGAWIILFLIFGMFGWGGMGGFGGFGGMGGGAYPAESILQRSLDTQTIIGKLDGVTQGLCDGFYAQSNALNGLGMNMMQGFSQAELSRCTQQAALMQQLYQMGYNQQDCCCQTQRAIEGVNYNLATQGCDTRNTIQNSTRDIIDSQNSGFRAILDKMCQQEIAAKDAQIAAQNQRIFALELSASQADQSAVLRAAMEANKADILRRTGNDCPVSAVVVQPPTPVSFPTNCCGTFSGWGNTACGTC